MKKFFVTVLLVVGMSAFAQENIEEITSEQIIQKKIEILNAELILDINQQEQIKQLFVELDNKKEIYGENLEEESKVIYDKMKAVLNYDQFEKWKVNQEKITQRINNSPMGPPGI